MKLLYLHQYFTFPQDAGGTRSYDLSRKFQSNGIDVTVLTTDAKMPFLKTKERWTFFVRDNIKFWVLHCDYNQKMSFYRRILSFIQFLLYSSAKIISIKTDVVLASSTPLTIAFPAVIKKIVSKVPFVFEVRDVWPEVPIRLGYIKNGFVIWLLRKFEKYIYKRAAFVVVLSQGMKKNILSRIRVENLAVIPNISEIERFRKKSQSVSLDFNIKNKKIVLYAGTLGFVNNIMYVAELAAKIISIDSDIIFVILGDGNEKNDIVDFCSKNGVMNKNIFFMDSISKDMLPYMYSLATLGSSFVRDNSVLWDNSANKFFDTLAASRPVLINHEGWQADEIRQNKCGFVLSPDLNDDNIKDFVNYLNDDALLKTHGENAGNLALKYSLDNATGVYLNILYGLYNQNYV